MSDANGKYRAFLMFGPPGSGKGTQGKALGQLPGLVHLAMGDLFRALDRESELGKVFVHYSSQGLLVPDDFTVRLWQDHVQRMVEAGQFNPASDCFLLDGIPRNPEQVRLLEPHVEVRRLIYLECLDYEPLVQRLAKRATTEGRADDADESVIRRRLQEYEAQTAAVLNCYPPEKVARINGLQTPVAVLADIARAVADSE